MAYQNSENYIIDPDIEDTEKPVVTRDMQESKPVSIKNNRLSDDYEVVQPVNKEADIVNEIHEAAVAEGLVHDDEDPIGGENATVESVIADLKSRPMSSGAQKNLEEYSEQKVEKQKKVMATREILAGMTRRLLNVDVDVVLDVEKPDGSIVPEVVALSFKVKRLTESESNYLLNRKLIGKKVNEMTNEELDEDNHFRAKFLSTVVVEPKMSMEEWYNNTAAVVLTKIYSEVSEVLSNIDDTDSFR